MSFHDKSLDRSTYSAKLIKGGKIVIPAELRREFGFKEGDTLVLEREGGGIAIKSYEQVVRDVQATFKAMLGDRSRSMVDELIAERRAEAARE
jgi:AbrB family transcriptional regulator, stage V sporulation protein T